MAEQKSVLLQSGLSYDRPQELAAAVEKIFCACPAARRLGPDSSVLLKPNLLGMRKALACRLFFAHHDRAARFLV